MDFFANSLAFDMFIDPSSLQDIDATVERMKTFCRALRLNNYYGLQTDFLRAESVIARGLDLALVKPVGYIFRFLTEQNVHRDLWEALV